MLKRVTGKLTGIFSDNQLKIEKNEETSQFKPMGGNQGLYNYHNEGRYAQPVEIGFRKYWIQWWFKSYLC